MKDHADSILATLDKVKNVVQRLIEIYAKTFRVNFSISTSSRNPTSPKESMEVYETLLLRVCALHRLKPNWDFDDFVVTMQIYHGTRPLADTAVATDFVGKSESFYERAKFDTWLELKTVRICSLPREARLVFTVHGRKTDHSKERPRVTRSELGWGSLQLFSFEK